MAYRMEGYKNFLPKMYISVTHKYIDTLSTPNVPYL